MAWNERRDALLTARIRYANGDWMMQCSAASPNEKQKKLSHPPERVGTCEHSRATSNLCEWRRATKARQKMLTGVELAKAVLKAKDRYTLLSLGSDVPLHVTKEGYLNLEDEDVRRSYVKIAARIHPDKLPDCADATKAFQALVRAYELCCKPDLRADDSDDSRDDDDDDDDDNDDGNEDGEAEADVATGAAASAVAAPAKTATKLPTAPKPSAKKAAKEKKPRKPRKAAKPTAKEEKEAKSAKACRTGVQCPRCHSDWGAHLKSEGQEGLYTLFMTGESQARRKRLSEVSQTVEQSTTARHRSRGGARRSRGVVASVPNSFRER